MTPNLGRPLPADEMLNHQTANLFSRVGESDLGWTEKIWFSIPKKDGSIQIDFGLGKYQNRNVFDGFAGISRGREQWTVRGSRVLSSDPSFLGVGPISYEIVQENAADLTDVERTVIEHRFGLDAADNEKPMTLEQVGQIIGVTKERVRQIQNKAMEKIRLTLEESFLGTTPEEEQGDGEESGADSRSPVAVD